MVALLIPPRADFQSVCTPSAQFSHKNQLNFIAPVRPPFSQHTSDLTGPGGFLCASHNGQAMHGSCFVYLRRFLANIRCCRARGFAANSGFAANICLRARYWGGYGYGWRGYGHRYGWR